MLKRKYMIIALTIVSVLLGSLFYNNITQAETGRYRIFQESVRVTAFSTETDYYGDRLIGGARLHPAENPMFLFEFSPKSEFLNVTDLWVSMVVYSYFQYLFSSAYEITINDKTIPIDTNVAVPVDRISLVSLHLLELTDEVVEGINELKIEAWGYYGDTKAWLRAYQIDVLITYEYQAR